MHKRIDKRRLVLLAGIILLLNGAFAAEKTDGSLTVDGLPVLGDVLINNPGSYRLSGSSIDAQVRVKAGKGAKVRLTLDGAELFCSRGAAIYAESGDVYLDFEGENRVSGGSDGQPAAIYVKDDLTLSGTGRLFVEGVYKNGVECRDGFNMVSGTVEISSAWDAVRGRDEFRMLGGTLKITSGNDAIKSDNDKDPKKGNVRVENGTITIDAGDDGITAVNKLAIQGGFIDITRCKEGLEAHEVSVRGGEIRIVSSDDGINANGDESAIISVSNGDIRICSGGDGLDSNGSFAFENGTLVVNATSSPRNSAFDYSGICEAKGGVLIASGSAAMGQAPQAADGFSVLRVFFNEIQPAGQALCVCGANGEPLAALRPENDYQLAIIAVPSFIRGLSISFYAGGEVNGLNKGEATLNGTLTGARRLFDICLDKALTSVDENGEPCDFMPNSLGW